MSDFDFGKTVLRDLVTICMGKKLGEGISRQVFEFLPDPSLVIKVEDRAGYFGNTLEWEIWSRVEHTEYAKWFAPCVRISACGTILLMKRTWEPHKLPYRLPAFLSDLKRENFGVLDGKFVCHDYSHTLIMEHGMTKAMRKAEWD